MRTGGQTTSTGRLRAAAATLALAAFALPVHAQDVAAHGADDPLGRATPRDAIVAFSRAADRGDFVAAARYLQPVADGADREALSRDLKVVIDRSFHDALSTVSDAADGVLNDGLPIDRERVGPLILVRTDDPRFGRIWLVSSETLAQLSTMRDAIGESAVERFMPQALVRGELVGVSYAHWIALFASVLLPILLLALAGRMVMSIARRVLTDPAKREHLAAGYDRLRWPVTLVVALGIHLMSLPSLGLPLTFRIAVARVALVALVIALAWLIRRIMEILFARARGLVVGRDRTRTQSLMQLGERALKALVVVAAVVAVLLVVGVDSKTALAAFGVVGIALALGARKSVENLLGGIFLLGDKAIAIGDLCTISNRLGWIEEITLRSVRLRTLENSIVSVPASVLAESGIENHTAREKILAHNTLRLRYGTSVEQLNRILGGVRALLDRHSRIESSSARIRLVEFGAEAIELELFAYVLTTDVPDFLAVREELLLEIATIVEAAGSALAPVRHIRVENDDPVAPAIRKELRPASAKSLAGATHS